MKPNDIASSLPGLRRRANVLLDEGRVPDAGRYNASEALRVLCRLALEQGTAPDALVLLHELQVHQVELDLQNEELVASRNALEGALLHQTYLFDHAPVGYLGIDANGVVTGRVGRALKPDPKAKRTCEDCKDDRKNQTIIGMEIIRGVKKEAGENVWSGGKILDPNEGKEYNVRFTPIEGGKKIQVRGYIGPFYRTQVWMRVE